TDRSNRLEQSPCESRREGFADRVQARSRERVSLCNGVNVMGLAFISKTGKQSRKRWDAQRIRLSTPNLFSQLAESVRTIVVVPLNGFDFCEGQRFELDVRGDRINVYHNRQLVGICDRPARSLLIAAKDVGGKILGEFQQMREHSGVAEIVVCVPPEVSEANEEKSVTEHEERYRTKT